MSKRGVGVLEARYPVQEHPVRLVDDLLNLLYINPKSLDTIAREAQTHDSTLKGWKRERHIPRIDIFINVANSIGYDVILRKQTNAPRS